MASIRTFFFSTIALLLLLLVSAQPAGAYSVLTHEQIIDLTWADSIQPLLLRRFPTLTPAQLREAHAYAYGGCVIQDLGYYPFGKPNFSDLLHYVRTGDFIRALFRDAKDANDVAFAIGALSHYLGDTIGHPDAINLAVALEFPELEKKYGRNVNYAQGPHQHARAEFAFDIDEITKRRLPPQRYLNRIGFAVPVPLLTRAFYDTYGLDLTKILKRSQPDLRGYRYSVRTLIPSVAYAETLLHGKQFQPDVPSPALDILNQDVAHLSAANNWNSYRAHPGFGTHLLAGFIFILPKVGPLSSLSIRIPTRSAKQDYLNSLVKTTAALRDLLAHATTAGNIPDKDLDTGLDVFPGTYSLEDYTYADLLHSLTRQPTRPIPPGKCNVAAARVSPPAPSAATSASAARPSAARTAVTVKPLPWSQTTGGWPPMLRGSRSRSLWSRGMDPGAGISVTIVRYLVWTGATFSGTNGNSLVAISANLPS